MSDQSQQETIYRRRFAGQGRMRAEIWRTLAHHFFARWIKSGDTVLELGAGYCEFINNISANKKFALDSNPATAAKAAPDVTVLVQDAAEPWALATESVDVVFTSNFFEHLSAKTQLSHCLKEAQRVLRAGGRLIALGPNIRFCSEVYWDFLDHHLPLSDRTMVEALEVAGFEVEQSIPKFLPYTMSGGFPYRPFMVRLYLALPFAQKLFGRQFLIVARKPTA
jgi:SAM-dependent methyltransferase